MNADEYSARVEETAQAFLTEHDALAWKQDEEHEGDSFWDYYNNAGEYGLSDDMHTTIDCACAQNWEDAIGVLQLTDSDPDQVDPGLYEGCDWKKILVIIAFDCFRDDVLQACERIYDNDEFEDTILDIPTTKTQIGYNDGGQLFKIPKNGYTINLHDGVKILYAMRTSREFAVVFEGPTEERPRSYRVTARRAYVMSGADDINEALERCRDEFGVRRAGE
jgi:hypothetical protein